MPLGVWWSCYRSPQLPEGRLWKSVGSGLEVLGGAAGTQGATSPGDLPVPPTCRRDLTRLTPNVGENPFHSP